MIVALLAAAVVAPPADALHKALAAAQASYRRRDSDPFSSVPRALDLDGQPFRLVIRAQPDSRGDFGQGSYKWKFDDGLLTFTLWSSISGLPMSFSTSKATLGNYWAQNGFGAKAVVARQRWERDGLVWLKGPASEDPKFAERYQFSIQLSGASARRASANTVAVIEGRLARLPEGDRVTRCSSLKSEASIGSPEDDTVVDCVAGAEVRRVSLVDQRTGATLTEWSVTGAPKP